MKKLAFGAMLFASMAYAHFGMVIPSASSTDSDKISLTYKFAHPFEGTLMDIPLPKSAGVLINGKKSDMLKTLKEQKQNNMRFYNANYNIKEPAVHIFYVDLEPYFEPNEQIFIHHTAKSVVDAYGAGDGWDQSVGLKAEIVPLTRPFGLYAGNNFSGVVMYKGKPAADVIVEVEYLNDKGLKAPSEDHITQEIKTNKRGEFSFTMPLAGWWGFCALLSDDEKIKKDGKTYGVELGAIIWVETKDYQK